MAKEVDTALKYWGPGWVLTLSASFYMYKAAMHLIARGQKKIKKHDPPPYCQFLPCEKKTGQKSKAQNPKCLVVVACVLGGGVHSPACQLSGEEPETRQSPELGCKLGGAIML